jgi:hypothetical protein
LGRLRGLGLSMNNGVCLLLSSPLFSLAFLLRLFVLAMLLNRGVGGINYLSNALCPSVNNCVVDFLLSVKIDVRHRG